MLSAGEFLRRFDAGTLDASGERLFPKGKRLLSHWNLRD